LNAAITGSFDKASSVPDAISNEPFGQTKDSSDKLNVDTLDIMSTSVLDSSSKIPMENQSNVTSVSSSLLPLKPPTESIYKTPSVATLNTLSVANRLHDYCSDKLSNNTKRIYYRGIKNPNNMCWIISSLQFLFTKQDWFLQVEKDMLQDPLSVDVVWTHLFKLFNDCIIIQSETNEKRKRGGQWEPISNERISNFLEIMRENVSNLENCNPDFLMTSGQE
jgi:hypothetical protein